MSQSTKQQLDQDLKQAMRDGDSVKRDTLRMVLATVQNAEKAKLAELPEADIIGILAKEARQRQESIVAFREGNRPELVAVEEAELAIILAYLPAQASAEEVTAFAREIIAEVGAETQRDKGKVMPKMVAEFKGKADGRMVNEIVTELLG
jgi:uncharacterized protein YqeY